MVIVTLIILGFAKEKKIFKLKTKREKDKIITGSKIWILIAIKKRIKEVNRNIEKGN